MKRARLFVLLLCSFLPIATHAQVQTGLPPFGSFNGAPDTVNLADLNVHLKIPVINKPGRGLNFVYNVTYDSAVWYPLSEGDGLLWEPVPGWGLNGTSFGYVGMATVLITPCITTGGVGGIKQTGTVTEYRWSYIDGGNTSHGFGTTKQVTGTITGTNCAGDTTTSINAQAVDGSGYTLSATGATLNSLTNSAGQQMNVPLNGPSPLNNLVTDRNGNQITSNNGGVFTDTLGTTVFAVAGSGTPSSPITLTYTAPSGANAVYTEKFTQQTVQTNFGCGNIAEYGPTSINLISEIDLPDIAAVPNDKYTFTYEATPGHSGNVTGRIAKITLPTGGTITYSYSGGSNGMTCADGITATLTRTTPDGTWTYAHTENGSWTTTVTDPTLQHNQSVYTFKNGFETEAQMYSGTSTLLQTVYVCYNTLISDCNGAGENPPFTSRAIYAQWPSGLESGTNVDYNNYGLPTEEDDYDYGSNGPGNLLRKTLITYASLGNDIVNMPASVTIQNGSGGTVAETTYQYDQGTLTSLSGTPQLVSISGSRGNLTTLSYLVTGSTFLSKTFTYYNTGNIDTRTDVNGSQSTATYNYSNATATCGNAFPSSVSEPLSLSRSMTWNCTGGVNASVTDENNQTVSTAWSDPYFWRPASSTDQDGNQSNVLYYPNANNPSTFAVVRYMLFNGSNSETSDYQYMDGLGRTYVDQHIESPSSSTLDSVSYTYDSNGRPASTSGPCPITWAQTCTGPTTTKTYDALNRPLVTTDGGGGTVTLTYSGNDLLQALGPAPSGENTKQRQSEYNGIGQLTSVCEITAGTVNAPAGTCAQKASTTGYWTTYSYDVMGHLLVVTQNAQSSSTQSRTYTYDGLGRMLSEANPEAGNVAVYYFYDIDPGTRGGANCSGTYNGDLVKRVDAAGNVTCYSYDGLHRQTSVTYPYGTNSSNTPGKFYVYDSATVNSVVMGNAKSRLAEAYTATCQTCSKITDEGFSYSPRGEIATEYESTPHSGGYYTASATYWANGLLDTLTGTASYSTTYAPDGKGRTYSAAGSLNDLKSTLYNSADEPTTVTLGNSDSDAYTYDPKTFRMTQYEYTIGASPQSLVGNLTWNANGSLAQLAITDPFNSTNTQTCNYTHDDLARIASGNCGPVWSQTFTYDAFGNITKAGSNSFNPGYNPITNRMNSGTTYDANGDVLTDSLHSYAWDVETRPTTIDTVAATYDALGRMVEQTKSGTSTEIQYAPTGFKMQTLNGQTVKNSFVPLPDGTVLVPQCACYFHADWLGGSRFASRYSDRTMYNDLAFAPFGEQYAQMGGTGVGNASFAGNRNDTTTNLYDAQFREYEIYGRWPSPDPAGSAAANPANPQSWNRYAYALNNPLALVDPNGMDVECIGGQAFDVESGYSDGQLVWTDYTPLGSCPGGGGGPGGGHQPGGGGSCVVGPCGPPQPTPPPNWKNCLNALRENPNEAYSQGLLNATDNWSALEAAGSANGIDQTLLASIALQESDFNPNSIQSNGQGVGAFQIDLGQNPSVTVAEAEDVGWASNWAAQKIGYSYNLYVNRYGPALALAGAIRNYNGSGGVPTSVLLNTGYVPYLNIGTNPPLQNYVTSVINIWANCF